MSELYASQAARNWKYCRMLIWCYWSSAVQCRQPCEEVRPGPVIGSDLQIRINIAPAQSRALGMVRRGFIIQSIMRLCGTDTVVAGYYVRTPITRDQSQVSVSVVTASSTLMILHKYTDCTDGLLSAHQATTTTPQLDSVLFHLLRNILNFGCGMLINSDLSRNYSDIVWSWSSNITGLDWQWVRWLSLCILSGWDSETLSLVIGNIDGLLTV